MLFDDFLVMRQIGLTQKLIFFCSGEMGFYGMLNIILDGSVDDPDLSFL